MKRPLLSTLALAALAPLALPRTALAYAEFVIEAKGEGFTDATPVTPVGGNRARTRGAQRLAAVKYAASVWSKLLDSPVPIVVEVEFSDLGCGDDATLTLAGARPTGIVYDGAARGALTQALPYALASRIAGSDVAPGDPDINMEINTAVDDACRDTTGGWYYGLDGESGGRGDLVDALLHELAHGLGFASLADSETGRLSGLRDDRGQTANIVDVYTSHVIDATSGRAWTALTDAERQRAATTPRAAVWDGAYVRAAVAEHLTRGVTRVTFDPPIPGFSGLIGDGGAGARPNASGVRAPLFVLPSTRPCTAPREVAGAVAVFEMGVGPCNFAEQAVALERAGAVGILVVTPAALGAAPISFAEPVRGGLRVPLLTLASADGARIEDAQLGLPRVVRIDQESTRYAGADAQGRPYLYTNDPADPGSNVSHFESLARPDLLMEPTARARSTHDVDLTRALLADLGWAITCGNGVLDRGEQCDEGEDNSDEPDARCHTTCMPPACGDGIVSDGEACDDGPLNSDVEPGACTTRCVSTCRGAGCDEAAPRGVRRGDDGGIAAWPDADDEDPRDEGGCGLASSSRSERGGLGAALGCLGLLTLQRRRRRQG
ncbi:MAG: PA domain-containing protein [Polyangiales bacterium]